MRKANKILALFLAVLMVVSCVVTMSVTTVAAEPAAQAETYPTTWWDAEGNYATAFAGGTGTADDPYEIATPAQLAYFAKYLEDGALNDATEKVYFELTAPIDMSAHQWKPIGYTAAFDAYATNTLNNADFDGNSFTISGINLSASKAISGYEYANGCALFTKVAKSTIHDLTLEARVLDPVFTAETAAETRAAAALVATLCEDSHVKNVTVNVDMDITSSTGIAYYGGLVGYSYDTTIYEVDEDGNQVLDENGDPIKTVNNRNTLNTVRVNGDINITGQEASTTKIWAGGVVGFYRLSRIDNVYNYANITYKAGYGNDTAVGGILGDAFCGVVCNVVENHGNLNITCHAGGYSHYGGCFGRLPVIRNTGKNIANYGTLTVNNNNSVDYTGGVVGRILNHASNYLNGIKNYGDIVYNKNSVQNSDYIGGIVGFMENAAHATLPVAYQCVNEGDITITYKAGLTVPSSTQHNPYIGGIIGRPTYMVFDGCTNKGNITLNNTYYGMRIGGIAGNLDGSTSATAFSQIKNCTNDGIIRITENAFPQQSSARYVGGMVGNLAAEHAVIDNCVNNGAIVVNNAQDATNAGGMAGNASKKTQTISNCVNYGDITTYDQNGNYHRNIGGIIAQMNAGGGKITNCKNYGDLTRIGVYQNAYLGGIVAAIKTVTVSGCENHGTIKMTTTTAANGAGTRYVGGIVGADQGASTIQNSTNYDPIVCEGRASNWYVGGISGYNASGPAKLTNVANYADITVTGSDTAGTAWIGGIQGLIQDEVVVTDTFNYGDVYATKTGNHYLGGIAGGLRVRADATTAAEMTNAYNSGSVGGIGAPGNKAYGGIVGRLSNDSGHITNPVPMYDIVNAVNVGEIQAGGLSGGIIGYLASSRKKVNTTDAVETACRYAVNLRACFAMNSGETYGLVGSARCAYLTFTDCFTDAEKYMSYCNQDKLYTGGTGITVNGTLYDEAYGGDYPINPTGILYTSIGTLEKARVRLDSQGTDNSGIRFDSYIEKATYEALVASGYTFELGTVIAPTDNLKVDSVVASYDKMEALDAIKVASNNTYVAIPYGDQFFAGENADYSYFAGALNYMKEANYSLKFTAIAYLTITVGDFTFTVYADYDVNNDERSRSIAQVACGAYEDRATSATTIDGLDYAFKATDDNACYLGQFSPYANKQLAKLKSYMGGYTNDKVVPDGLTVNGVSIEEYKIVYAQSPIYKKYGSATGKTLYEDLSNFKIEQYTSTKSDANDDGTISASEYTYTATGNTYVYGDVLLGARYDYDEQSAKRLQAAIYAEYGVMLPVVEDEATAESTYEILVGKTNRAKSQSYKVALLSPDDYLFHIDDTKILVVGGAYGTTWHAIDKLEKLFADIDEPNYNLKMAGNLSGYYKMQKIATIGDSITRGSQSLPDGNDYGGPNGATAQFGSNAVETYFRYFLSYPANLQRLIWKDAVVYNFGRGASTAINLGNSNYYGGSSQWNDCKEAMEDVDFDLVFMQHGTNDSNSVAALASRENDYYNEVKALIDTILADSPDCKFVINSVPHAFDSNGGGSRNEANDENMRRVQKETAQKLKAAGYDIYHYNMGEFTRINLVTDGAPACPGYTTAGDYKTAEVESHSYYYNINTGTSWNEGTHPNYRGYNKMADGALTVVNYLLFGGAKPALMINIG